MSRTGQKLRAAALASVLSLVGLVPPAIAQEPPPQTGFETNGGTAWTTAEEEQAFLAEVDERSDRVEIEQIATAASGKPVQLVRLGGDTGPVSAAEARTRTTILLVCSQHGNEPAGRETCLKKIRDLAFTTDPALVAQLESQTILFVPTANPDGREDNRRTNDDGTDINRDHLALETLEARAIGAVARDYQPEMSLDLHEYGPGQPVVYDDDVLFLWPRNRNVDVQVHDLAVEYSRDFLEPCVEGTLDVDGVEGADYSADEYGLADTDPGQAPNGNPAAVNLTQTAGGGDEGIARNAAGLRHTMGILVESAVTPKVGGELLGGPNGAANLNRRVASQVKVVDCTLAWFRANGERAAVITGGAPARAAAEGLAADTPIYTSGQYEDTTIDGSGDPEETIDPPPCAYTFPAAALDANDLRQVLGIHGITTSTAGGVTTVSMAQAAEPVIPLLLDERANRDILQATPVLACTGPELTLSVPDVVVDEGDDEAVLALSLNAAADRAFTVRVVTADGTATAGEDYTAVDTEVAFAVGERTQTVAVPLLDDDATEDQERLTLVLTTDDPQVVLPAVAPAISIVDDETVDTAAAPEADAVIVGRPIEGRPVTFDATGSTDADGDIASYAWDFGDGSAPAAGAVVQHTYADDGTVTATVTVTDRGGRRDTATVEVVVTNLPPRLVVGDDRTVEDHTVQTLSATTDDVDDDTVTVSWSFGDGSPTATGETVAHAWTDLGTFTVRVTARDEDGGASVQTLEVTVVDSGTVGRAAGPDRVATAVEVSRLGWPDGADEVLLARADDFPDALAGSRLAAELDAPLLLTASGTLSDAAEAELERLDPERVTILGGEAAIQPSVATAAAGDDRTVRRIAGDDRYVTAALIADEVGASDDQTVVLALGNVAAPAQAWPDALSSSSLAVAPDGLPILLTTTDTLPAATVVALDDLDTTRVVIAGGESAVSQAVAADLVRRGYDVARRSGDSRYDTSVALAGEALQRWGDTPVEVVFATGLDFPDGLTAGAFAARRGAVVLLVHPTDLARSPAIRTFLRERALRFDVGTVVGGPAAISASVRDELEDLITEE